MKIRLTRREFLKVGGLALGGLALKPWERRLELRGMARYQNDFPEAEYLARVAAGAVEMRIRPDVDSPSLGLMYEDQVVPWLREVVGRNPYRQNQRWVETPDGYMWSPFIQPTKNIPQTPVTALQSTSLGEGMWVQVSVPWVDVALENAAPLAPSVKLRAERGLPPRFYYQQVIWVDQIDTDSTGQVWYRLNERFSYGDVFWGPAEAFRPITREEVEPISPEVANKRIVINKRRQDLSAFEDDREVFYCRCSTGQIGEDTETPAGEGFWIWRKMLSTHMSGGTTGGGWDLPAVAFVTFFIGDGIAFHGTFWHSNYGEKQSRGCVNVTPEDAKWIFRWTHPAIGYDPGDVTVTDFTGTQIKVMEG